MSNVYNTNITLDAEMLEQYDKAIDILDSILEEDDSNRYVTYRIALRPYLPFILMFKRILFF